MVDRANIMVMDMAQLHTQQLMLDQVTRTHTHLVCHHRTEATATATATAMVMDMDMDMDTQPYMATEATEATAHTLFIREDPVLN